MGLVGVEPTLPLAGKADFKSAASADFATSPALDDDKLYVVSEKALRFAQGASDASKDSAAPSSQVRAWRGARVSNNLSSGRKSNRLAGGPLHGYGLRVVWGSSGMHADQSHWPVRPLEWAPPCHDFADQAGGEFWCLRGLTTALAGTRRHLQGIGFTEPMQDEKQRDQKHMSSHRNRRNASLVRTRKSHTAFRSDSTATCSIANPPSSTPVIQQLEPRKLLTTLYAGGQDMFGIPADPSFLTSGLVSGYFSSFIGYIAMPAFVDVFSGAPINLSASTVGSRSVLVMITIIDPTADPLDPTSGPSATILDLDGNPLYPWRGQPDGSGTLTTDVEASIATGSLTDPEDDDGFWGTDDDETASGFGLDIGYNPGYRLFPGLDFEFGTGDDVWAPDWFFHSVRQLDYDEDEGEFSTEDIPEEFTFVIPHTGIWHNGDSSGDPTTAADYEEQLYLTDPAFWNDSRTPAGILGETDDRLFGSGDDPSAGDGGAYGAPSDFAWHLIDRFTSPSLTALQDYADDGVADFNNGIGQIIFRNTTQFTRFTITALQDNGDGTFSVLPPFGVPDDSDVGVSLNVRPSNDVDGSVVQAALMGRIIIGNPTNADWTVDDPLANFGDFIISVGDIDTKRDGEGIVFETPALDEVIGRISIDGALFGRNLFPGSLEILHVGYLGGSVEVDGEVNGGIIVAGDAGFIDYTDENQSVLPRTTGAFISVGRNIGSVLVGGRNAAFIAVDGDLFDYSEKPAYPGNNVLNEFESVIDNADEDAFAFQFSRGNVGYIKDPIEGDDPQYLHNDTISFAQFIGRANSVVTVSGSIGGGENFGRHSGDADDFDYYAIAVDGLSKITITLVDPLTLLDLPAYVSVQDERGRVLASRGEPGQGSGISGAIEFTPDHAGLVYIVIQDVNDLATPAPYLLTVQGHEATTLGEVNTIEQFQYRLVEGTSILTSAGSIGAIRSGQNTDTTDNGNVTDMIIDSARSIWNVTAGHNVGADDSSIFISADVNIGSILAGFGRAEDDTEGQFIGGSVLSTLISAGNDIGLIWALEAEDDFGDIGGLTESGDFTPVATTIQAEGSIGVIRAGNRIYGPTTLIQVGDEEVIDVIEAGMTIARPGEDEGNLDIGRSTDFGIIRGDLAIQTGSGGGGNVRFVRAPNVAGNTGEAPVIELEQDTTLRLVDDSGAVFTIRINGGSATGLSSTALITTQGINSSQGVAVARIEVFLAPGAELVITNDSGQVEIGDIIVNGSAGGIRGNRIIFNGSGETDVLYLRANGAFDEITNSTTGDMIAIDVTHVDRVNIRGNLGRTNNIAIGPKLIGPQLPVVIAAPTGAEEAIAGAPVPMNPIGLSGQQDPLIFGGPFDDYLNGLLIRVPNPLTPVESVRIDGVIGDVIIFNNVERIVANADGDRRFGVFQGIDGTVYVEGNLEFIDVGDGLNASVPGPNLTSAITVLGQLVKLVAVGEGHDIRGIIAANGLAVVGGTNGPQDVEQAIGLIELSDGANMIGAYISTAFLDDYWNDPISSEDRGGPRGDIKDIRITNGDMVDTFIEGVNVGLAEFTDIRGNLQRRIGAVSITGGVWDSNRLLADEGVGRVNADSFIATFVDDLSALEAQDAGTPLQARSLILATDNIESVETNGQRGDIIDLLVSTLGNMESLRGFNIIGVAVDIDANLDRVDAKGYISRSKFVTGIVGKFEAQGDIDRVTLEAAGAMSSLRSKTGEIRRIDLIIDGPDGRLDKMTAVTGISGEIAVSGEVRQIKTTSGDITASIRTFSGDGYIKEISAGRDLLIDLDADGNVDRLRAARDVGNGGTINVRGNLKDLDASKGTLFSPVVVNGNITGKINVKTMGPLANITAGGSIKQISIAEDLDNFVVSHSGGISKIDIRGSLLSDGSITSNDGALNSVKISGNADGDIFSDRDSGTISISGNLTGSVTGADSLKQVSVNGDATGALIHAGTSLSKVSVKGSATSTIFGAGRTVSSLSISGNATNVFVLGGLETLGDDGALGGAADDADVFTAGSVDKVDIKGSMDSSVVAAGISGGADGSYATLDADADQAEGTSSIGQVKVSGLDVGGNVFVADTSIGSVTFGVSGSATQEVLTATDPSLPGVGDTTASFSNGSPFTLTQSDGDVVTFSLRGPGTATVEYFAAGGAITGIIFIGTDTRTNVDITVTGGSGDGLVDFSNAVITGADDASFNTLNIDANLEGGDSVAIDGAVQNMILGSVSTTGTIAVGGRLDRLTTGAVTLGTFDVTDARSVTVNGSWIGQIWQGETLDSLTVNGAMTGGIIYTSRSLGSVDINGLVDISNVGTAGTFDRLDVSVSSGNGVKQSVFFAGDDFNFINITGDVADSDFIAGVSLGEDSEFGGTDGDADSVSQGAMGKVNVRGNWARSSVAAGVSRGEDTYFGTTDDRASLGISSIDGVTISGQATGTLLGSQSFAFTSSGTVGRILVAGQTFDQNQNLIVKPFTTTPLPLRVESTEQDIISGDFIVRFTFNAQVETSTLEDAIIVESATTLVLVDPSDYEIVYEEDTQTVSVIFSAAFVNANPDVYTITIDAAEIRGRSGAILDGDSDGTSGDDFADNFLIGDAGDRLSDGDWDSDDDGSADVDLLAPVSLDLLLESEKNREITLVGSIGDHPDDSPFFFPQKMDVDIFEVALDSGDIFRAAFERFTNGSVFIGSISLRAVIFGQLVTIADEDALSSGFLSTSSGTFYLVIGSADLNGLPLPAAMVDVADLTVADDAVDAFGNPIDPDILTNDIGRYTIHTSIANDGSTGFDNSTPVDLVDGVSTTITGFIGQEDNGVPVETEIDVDVYLINSVDTSGGVITELTEGMSITITVAVESLGGDLGAIGDIGLYRVIDDGDINGGTLMGAPALSLTSEDRPLGAANDYTLSVRIPTTGQYAILIQGSTRTDYQIEVTVNTGTAGDRYSTPQVQNVLIETGGGFVEWYGARGTSLVPFNLDDLGFNGLEDEVLEIIEQVVEDLYADAGVIVDVAYRTADFAVPGEFTTIYLANNYGADNSYGGLLGIAQSLDPLNQDRSEEAIIFVNSFTGFVPGQTNDLGTALGTVVAHELGHTLGLRHNGTLEDIMFPGYTGDQIEFVDDESPLTELLLGSINTHDLLNLIFDTEAV